MERTTWMRLSFVVTLAAALTISTAWARQERREHAKKANGKLPAAVAKAIKAAVPNAEIGTAELEKEAGINLYDIEFKADKGEIEVAEDGTVMDIATIVIMKDIPRDAAEAIQTAATGATIRRVERSEIRAEIKKEGEMGKIVKLAAVKYVFEAELMKGDQRGEIQVAPDGKIVEGPKWNAREAKEKEETAEKEENKEKEETEEAKESKVDLKILPAAVLNAFKTAYPNAVIKGTSQETEGGVTYYEVESVDGKLNRDLLYSADGQAVEIEEAVSPGDLPAAVRLTLTKAYPGAKVLKAEELTKGSQKLYELMIQGQGKPMGVTIDAEGKIVETAGGAATPKNK